VEVIGLRNRVLWSIGFIANRCRIPPTKLAWSQAKRAMREM